MRLLIPEKSGRRRYTDTQWRVKAQDEAELFHRVTKQAQKATSMSGQCDNFLVILTWLMMTQRRLDQTKMTTTIDSKNNSPIKLHVTVKRSGETAM